MYIDPKIVDMANGITYTKPKLLDRIKGLFGIKFKPQRLESVYLMDMIPRVTNPKSICKIESVTTA